MYVSKQESDFERRKKRRDKVISTSQKREYSVSTKVISTSQKREYSVSTKVISTSQKRGYSVSTKVISTSQKREYSISTKAAYTSQTERNEVDGKQKAKRWRLKEEMIKLFDESLRRSFPEYDGKPVVCAGQRPGHGDFNCENVLSIWPMIRKSRDLLKKHNDIKRPRDVGEKIKNNLPRSDMIMKNKWTPSVHDVGFVTVELSRKWVVENIYNMIKHGIDTWAPKLPVGRDRVVVRCPSLDEETHVGLFQRMALGLTLFRMLEYSGASVSIRDMIIKCAEPLEDHHTSLKVEQEHARREAQHLLNRCFSITERSGDVVINGIGKPPFTLAKRDYDKSYKDVETLRYFTCQGNADWIVYISPVRQQEYIEMCFTAAKLAGWIPSDGHKPPTTSYAGYRSCTTNVEEDLLDKARTHFVALCQGEAAKLLGYTAEAVKDCVVTYALLKNHRLAIWSFDIKEFNEEGNTFVYLLNTQAKIRRITDEFREDINELKKTSELILKKNKGWGTSEERTLELHLLQFTDALEQSCLYVLPHILCKYVYGLSKKFTSFYSHYCSARKIGSIVETSTVLLCEATAVVMEKCFHLLGITPEISNPAKTQILRSQSSAKRPVGVIARVAIEYQMRAKRKEKEVERNAARVFKDLCITRSISVARDPPRNSRLELFTIIPFITTDYYYELEELKLFGLIAVSDKYGLLPDGGSHVSEPDFAYVPLFDVDCCDAIDMRESGILYLGNPSCRHSVSFSSSIEVRMELTATTERKNACFQLCSHKFKIDSSDIWEKEMNIKFGCLVVDGEDGSTQMHYILIKDAVDADLELHLHTKTPREVCGLICAYYGGHPTDDSYVALLFQSDDPFVLNHGRIPLERSRLAVPMDGSIIIEVDLMDVNSGEVIFKGSHTFKSQRGGISQENMKATSTDCSLCLKVSWKYQG